MSIEHLPTDSPFIARILCADSYDETKWYRVEDEIVSDPLTQHTKLYS